MKNGCFFPADILLPKENLEKWSVIACDQYTSNPEYWYETEKKTGDSPSAFHLILPEAFLSDNSAERIAAVNHNMRKYISDDIFRELPNAIIYTERIQSDGLVRYGLVGMIDLRRYDFKPGSDSAIRATEETVLERIPPRVKIRENAPLELPHIMLLADDPENTVLGPVSALKSTLEQLYNFRLMQNGGYISGYLLNTAAVDSVDSALSALLKRNNGLLFCVGDGNHSLAAAKAAYEKNPDKLSPYALCEIVNIHSPALNFEPIYRAVFGIPSSELINMLIEAAGGEYCGNDAHCFICVTQNGERKLHLRPTSELPVGTLQTALDKIISTVKESRIDYIHGEHELRNLCNNSDTTGFLFRGMKKEELFPSVSADGSLPRKTFSMGHADDKRFYLEARKIQKY